MIRESLDRFVGTNHLFSRFPDSYVENITTVGFDHCPIIVEALGAENIMNKKRKNCGYRFHFEEFWVEHEECSKIIE